MIYLDSSKFYSDSAKASLKIGDISSYMDGQIESMKRAKSAYEIGKKEHALQILENETSNIWRSLMSYYSNNKFDIIHMGEEISGWQRDILTYTDIGLFGIKELGETINKQLSEISRLNNIWIDTLIKPDELIDIREAGGNPV